MTDWSGPLAKQRHISQEGYRPLHLFGCCSSQRLRITAAEEVWRPLDQLPLQDLGVHGQKSRLGQRRHGVIPTAGGVAEKPCRGPQLFQQPLPCPAVVLVVLVPLKEIGYAGKCVGEVESASYARQPRETRVPLVHLVQKGIDNFLVIAVLFSSVRREKIFSRVKRHERGVPQRGRQGRNLQVDVVADDSRVSPGEGYQHQRGPHLGRWRPLHKPPA